MNGISAARCFERKSWKMESVRDTTGGGDGGWRLLRALGSAVMKVLLLHGVGEIDVEDIGERREPRQHIGEFLVEVGRVAIAALVTADGVGQLANLLGEPEERRRRAAGGIGGEIAIANELLKLRDEHGVSGDERGLRARSLSPSGV